MLSQFFTGIEKELQENVFLPVVSFSFFFADDDTYVAIGPILSRDHSSLFILRYFPFLLLILIFLTLLFSSPRRFHKRYSVRRDMIIVKLCSESLPTVAPLRRVFTTRILIYVIPPLTHARDSPSVPKITKARWNPGPRRTSSWLTVAAAHLCKKFVTPNVQGQRV